MEKLRKKWIWIKSKLPKKQYQGKFDFQAVLSQNGLICQETVPIYNKNGDEIKLDLKLNHVMTEDSQLNFIELFMKLDQFHFNCKSMILRPIPGIFGT